MRAGETTCKVIADIINYQHLPFGLNGFEDCRKRYIKEFASDLYQGPATAMALEIMMLRPSGSKTSSERCIDKR